MLILLPDVLIANFDHLSCYWSYWFEGNSRGRAHTWLDPSGPSVYAEDTT